VPRDWDAFYGSGGVLGGGPVFVVRAYAGLMPPGPVLDLAGGSGRNAVYLASRGRSVLLLDASADALARAAEMARAAGTELELARRDLEEGLPPGLDGFAGVVVSYYVQRRLLPQLPGVLLPGGLVLLEGFDRREARRRGRESSPHYWEVGELLRPPAGLEILAAGEGWLADRWRTWAVWRRG